MDEFYAFASGSPFVTAMLVFSLYSVCELVFRCWNRFLRHLNIRAKGWPPAHCDADGDPKPEPEPEVA